MEEQKARLIAQEKHLDSYRQEIESIESSISWRVTWPLRAIKRLLKRTPDGGAGPAERSPSSPPTELEALESKLVWVLGSPRTGSTWLCRLMSEFPQLATIDEPLIGAHLVPVNWAGDGGDHFAEGPRAKDRNYFFATENVREFRPLLRQLVLNGLAVQAHALADGRDVDFVVVKEPNGSHASETIISLVPGSRMIFLCRDGRDVVDSLLDLQKPGSWWDRYRKRFALQDDLRADPDREMASRERMRFVRNFARGWVRNTAAAQRAFELLPPERRLRVCYEDLLLDTASELNRIHNWLGLEVDAEQLEAAVEKHSFSNVPDEERGPGEFARTASPGLWRQTFTKEEQAAMEEIMGPQLQSLGYGNE